MISKQSHTQTLLSSSVLPNFVKTVLFAAAAATSVSTFAGHHGESKKVGELKDMKKKEAMLKDDEMSSSLMPKAENTTNIKENDSRLLKETEELKVKTPDE